MINFDSSSTELGYQIIESVLGHEGGYVNHPLDKGGPTNWGITQATARRYGFNGNMRELTRTQAVDIYVKFFWVGRFDIVAGHGMPRLAYALADFGVNSGTGRPAEALQRSLNALNKNGTLYSDISVDGAIGNQTMGALNRLKAALPPREAERLLTFAVNSLRVAFIINLAERDPRQEAFMLGWLRRYLQVSETARG